MSSTTLLMVSHDSAETTLQASRISHRSASSPYVLCFECSEDFSVDDERRNSATYFVPRRTSSSPHPRRQRLSGPPTPPLPMNLLPPSPLQSSCHHPQPDGQDGRSSKAVKPRRKQPRLMMMGSTWPQGTVDIERVQNTSSGGGGSGNISNSSSNNSRSCQSNNKTTTKIELVQMIVQSNDGSVSITESLSFASHLSPS